MNITFIVPSWHYFHESFRLTTLLGNVLRNNFRKQLGSNYNIKICDLRGISEKKFSEAVKKIPQSDFYIYWIMKSGDALEVYSIVKYLKTNQKIRFILRVVHMLDMLQDECEKYFDKIVVGPGEKCFFDAITDKDIKKNTLEIITQSRLLKQISQIESFLNTNKVISDKMFIKYGSPKATMVYFSRRLFL